MTAEREALRMGIEHLTVLFPTEVSSFDFKVENSGRTVQYKFNAQSLRLFGLHSCVFVVFVVVETIRTSRMRVIHIAVAFMSPRKSPKWWQVYSF